MGLQVFPYLQKWQQLLYHGNFADWFCGLYLQKPRWKIHEWEVLEENYGDESDMGAVLDLGLEIWDLEEELWWKSHMKKELGYGILERKTKR